MIIKICGLRRIEDAEIINEFNEIKYAGFVFAKSKRQVTIDEVLNIKKHLRKDIMTVGVFADQSVEEVIEICQRAKLDICQLHSNEDNKFCTKIKIPVWKSIAMKDCSSLEKANEYENVQGFLLDTYSEKERGGIGKVFNWDIANDFSKNYFTILAGGINAENINRAFNKVKPNVVDLSSSAEEDGYKSYNKIKELIEVVRKD